MISRIRTRNLLVVSLMLAAAGLISSSASLSAGDAGYAPSIQSAATATVQGKIPFPRPDTHRGNWIEYHGTSANLNINEAGQNGKSCLTCHERNDCLTCHNTRMPRDHTNTWRTLSHGFMAEGNRERCAACHRQDYCVRCHNETAPRTHTGNWAKRHCTWCHFGSGLAPADACFVCHKTASHTSRPSPHPPIGAQTQCAACHH